MSKNKSSNAKLWKNKWRYVYTINAAGKANIEGKVSGFGIRDAMDEILKQRPEQMGRNVRIENVGVQNHQRYEFQLGRPHKWIKVERVA